MPELHKLTPYLGLLQNRGFKVALLTDGRMSGASGKVLSAIKERRWNRAMNQIDSAWAVNGLEFFVA